MRDTSRCSMMSDQISKTTLIALYFALNAARKSTDRIVISNEILKQYFFGDERGRRLSESQISKWAETLKPIVADYEVKRSQYGPFLILYLNDKTNASLGTKPVRLSIPGQATIRKTFGIG